MTSRRTEQLRLRVSRFAADARVGLRALAIIAVLPVLLTLSPEPGGAVHRGLTPSQVFGLWTNINASLDAVARVISDDTAWRTQLRAMRPKAFRGKRPADVLEQVKRYQSKIDALRRRAGLPPSERHSGHHHSEHQHSISPSVVYIASGTVLNAQIEWLIHLTERNQLVSQYYRRHDFSGKISSDVFGIVELANRRLDAILTKAGVRPTAGR